MVYSKVREKEDAIQMRRHGKTYSEILSEIPVAKSTLSLWLRSVGLAAPQLQRITKKRIEAQKKGARARYDTRIQQEKDLLEEGRNAIRNLTRRELWLIGTALYWAEGSKQNTKSISAGIMFANSDFRMIRVFLAWLVLCGIQQHRVVFELYVHKDRARDSEKFRRWWAEKIGVDVERISRIYYKKGNPKTLRSNVGDLYHGLIRIKVSTSTVLNRTVSGWVGGIVAAVGDGVTGNTSAFGAEDSRFDP